MNAVQADFGCGPREEVVLTHGRAMYVDHAERVVTY